MSPKRKSERTGHGHASEDDGIDVLPDALLQHILSFLTADEAVMTSVLSRRWRHLWRRTAVLRVADSGRWKHWEAFNKFVNHLVLSRGSNPLHRFELGIEPCREEYVIDDDNAYRYVMMWVMYALVCHVRELKITNLMETYVDMDAGVALVSRHLTTLELSGLRFDRCSLDFSSCPALQALCFTDSCCFVSVKKISSRSIQRLGFRCPRFSKHHRTRVHAPSIVTLNLDCFWGRTPFLEAMPSLVTGFVRPDEDCDDWCGNTYAVSCEDGSCEGCYGMADEIGDGSAKCVLLGGLSEARDLELIAGPEMRIFRSDLRWCPMFSKLKTLLLNDWCVATNFWALACILERSPVLEKLTLQVSKETKPIIGIEENHSALVKPPAISKHLKVVRVHCKEVDEGVCKILKFLTTLDVEVIIKRMDRSATLFSFEEGEGHLGSNLDEESST
ncbi:F-box protein At4g09920 [Oryza brachyantha]|uniref:F-box family-1 n=1 Tax=Oryza brachyantha TaxID=4533 RepID=B9V0I6_ORYBR|nr:F-box protein At4g09920 [Oryza brachyantha]ACM17553.1 F-box family-1 [Oryza brachyantha]